ncbi:unnamed protein product [Rotaria sp. Silwood2]|nr:unnamed protein product [Rotaria sp. Silwood2]CAF3950249.1 unnamed protein product [Rotaria sp. Silwood2]CAF4056220.1 unnamed protein product [Rotaria sp. Silwood2]CAF4115739.1 unnamed protein product [Rotaria sp. Silwood2]
MLHFQFKYLLELTVINRVRHLSNFAYQQLSILNIFESKTIRTRTNLTREYFLTRLFICTFIISSIGIGFYIFISEQNQVVTIIHPSLETYENLFNEYSTTIQCPCSQVSVPYGAFLNVTFVLHQVCSSDLVSPSWLHYLASFNPTLVPAWTETRFSRDFRLEGVSYFQLLATFCSLAKINIEDGQRIFTNTQFINDQLLPRSIFVQQTEALAKSFINKTCNDFLRILNWIDIAGSLNRFLTGTNFNFKITVSNDTKVNIEDVSLVADAEITHTWIFMTTLCSCIKDATLCFVKSLIYLNGSNFADFLQVFDELDVGCMPLMSFFHSTVTWWYNKTYFENIQATYASIINTQFPTTIKPLNSSILTQFNQTASELVNAMFVEMSFISDQRYDLFYSECAPISCSYTEYGRRNIVAAVLLLISVCGGLNRGLRLLVPLIGKLILILIKKWRNRNIVDGKCIMQARSVSLSLLYEINTNTVFLLIE